MVHRGFRDDGCLRAHEEATGGGRDGGGGGRGDGCAGYLSVERGGVGESGWEGRRQLRRVQRV